MVHHSEPHKRALARWCLHTILGSTRGCQMSEPYLSPDRLGIDVMGDMSGQQVHATCVWYITACQPQQLSKSIKQPRRPSWVAEPRTWPASIEDRWGGQLPAQLEAVDWLHGRRPELAQAVGAAPWSQQAAILPAICCVRVLGSSQVCMPDQPCILEPLGVFLLACIFPWCLMSVWQRSARHRLLLLSCSGP